MAIGWTDLRLIGAVLSDESNLPLADLRIRGSLGLKRISFRMVRSCRCSLRKLCALSLATSAAEVVDAIGKNILANVDLAIGCRSIF